MKPTTFTLLPEHIALLRRANVDWSESEAGAPRIDPKRPYGNSGFLTRQIAEILGWTLFEDACGEKHLTREQDARAGQLHRETETALRIILQTGSFEPGRYVDANGWGRGWQREGGRAC